MRVANLTARLRRFALPTMAGLLGLYVALHSPLRDIIAAAVGMKSRGCFFCTGSFSINQLADALSAIVLIALAVVAAWIISNRFESAWYEQAIVFGLCGLVFIAVPASIIGDIGTWLGNPLLRPPFGPLLTAIPAMIVIVVSWQQGWRFRRPRVELRLRSRLIILLGAVVTVSYFASAAISMTHPATGFDALGYHAPLAVFLWRDGNLGAFLDRAPGNWPLANPGTAELWFGLGQILGGERLAILAQFPFAILASVAAYAFTRRIGLRGGAGLLSAFAFLLIPMVILQSGMQLNDVVGAALLMSVIALASAPIRNWTHSRLALIGLGLGLVAVTKLALLPCVAAVGLFIIGELVWRRTNLRLLFVQLLIVAIFSLIAVAPWWVRNIVRQGNPFYPAALPLIGRGFFDASKADAAFVSSPILWPVYSLVEKHDEQSGFGLLFLTSIIPGFFFACVRGRRQPLLLFLFVTAIMLPAWWVLTQHFPRFLLSIAGLSFAFLPWSLMAIPRRQRWLGETTIAIAAIFSVLVTFDQALLPFARQPNTRAAFYDRVWAVDPAALRLPDNAGILLHTGFARTIPEYTAYYPLLGEARSRVVIPVNGQVITESLIARMQDAGVQYAYVTASPNNRSTVESMYDPAHFKLIAVSTINPGERSGARRYLFQPVSQEDAATGTRRYLYRLK